MSLSIRWRLAAGIVLSFVVTLAVIFITVQFALSRILTDNLDEHLLENLRTVQGEATLVGSIEDDEDVGRLQTRIDEYATRAGGRTPFLTVIRDTSGAPVVSSGVQELYLRLAEDDLQRVLDGDELKSTLNLPGALAGGDEYRVNSQRLAIGGEVVGIIQVAQATEGVTDAVNTLLVILIPEGIAAIVLAVGIAIWLSGGAVRPLRKVIDIAADIQAHDLTKRIDAREQPSEVQKLADTFDAMLARLEKAFREQEDFVLDVSHELRTPLTVLKGNIEVLLMDSSLDPETRSRFEQMSIEISRMIRLTSNLLYFASAEAGREPERLPVELDVVCLEVLRQARELRRAVKVSLGDEDQVVVTGDRDQMKQMVLNLVENAIKYTPDDGEVTLSVYKNDSMARVQVTDTGPGIPREVQEHIFDRFYQGGHRSVRGGTGLGLSIASRIAVSHGGRIEVESELGKGSTFTVHLPLAQDGGG